MKTILTPYKRGAMSFKNHLVMAPMMRSRAIGNLPNALMAEYYGQRTGAGLIITEGTAPTPEGLGYPRIPGIYTAEQIEGWKQTTTAVHKDGSKIFLQIMHTGRIGHIDNLPAGLQLSGVSNQKAAGKIFTDTLGLQDHSEPVALTLKGIKLLIKSYATAAKNAITAGFDGVELDAADGYLLEQFLNPHVNDRTDEYGGSVEKRAQLILDIAAKTAAAIGKDKTGIRLSPYSILGDLKTYDNQEVYRTYTYLAKQLNEIGIAYIHISLNSKIPQSLLNAMHNYFMGTIIFSSGLTPETAKRILDFGTADLVGFAKFFLANPDFHKRLEESTPLNEIDINTLNTANAEGYTDYPFLENSKILSA